MKQKGTKDLTFTQRRELENYLKAGLHKKRIAELLGVCLATVYNEINRGKTVKKEISYVDRWGENHYRQVTVYSADKAEYNYRLNQSTHGAPLKIGNDFELVRYIENRVIDDKLSPCAVLGEIKRKKLFKTTISKTTLYRYIRTGFIFTRLTMQDVKLKQKRYQHAIIKRTARGVSIEKRPAEIAERNTFGHWEMDSVIGKAGTRETILAFTERLTRYEIIFKLPDHKAASVINCVNKLEKRFGKNFCKLFKSITVDNGVEFSDFKGIEKSIYGGKRTSVFYCHPYSSCERGSNERLNREIRRLIPKGTDFSTISEKRIRAVENWINSYPREIFGYATSAEMFKAQLQAI
ncbi:MAG: IS30 family transposase [Clostridia bacterium]|nr:IS30 family transposase [Clostridia bacterium]